MKRLLLVWLLSYLFFYSCSYLPEEVASIEDISIHETADYIQIKNSNGSVDSLAGIMFLPGGLVDPHAYINLLSPVAVQEKRTVVIVKVDANLAVWNVNKAFKLQNKFPEINTWVLGGHSLGGAMSCYQIRNEPNHFSGMFLLAAYSNKDISNITSPVLSITASNDKVLNWDEFNKYKKYLPDALEIQNINEFPTSGSSGKTVYYTIEGGNHGQFGSYGKQDGDGSATISASTQHQMVREALSKFLSSNQL